MSVNSILLAVQAAFIDLEISATAVFSPPNRGAEADLQCNSIVQFCGRNKRSDGVALAQAVTEKMRAMESNVIFSVSGPGFLNLKFTPEFVVNSVMDQATSETFGIFQAGQGQTAVIDFGGPNVAKTLHVGHLRSFVLGESLRRTLLAVGYQVVSDIHLGDWGLQMGKLLLGLEIVEGDLSPDRLQTWTLQDLENFYLIGSRACMEVDGTQECLLERARFLTTRLQEGDVTLTAIWKEMRAVSLNAIGSIVDLLGCHFDLYKGESDSHIAVESMLSGFASNDELIDDAGSKLVATGTGEELLLLKSGTGSVLYAATDLATIKERVDAFAPNKIIYCVDQRQDQHFKSVFSAAHRHDMAGNAALIHAGFGTVKGHDGKPFKTRDGGTVKLHELLDHATQAVRRRMHSADDDDIRKVAIGALKFADLQSDRTKGYVFDLEAMCSFEGCTGPYLQYACVRISSLLAKAGDFKMELRPDAISAEEKAALLIMLNWPNVVDRAATDLKPHYIGEHVFRLAQAFSRVYAKEPILDAEDTGVRVSRLSFCSLLMGQLTQGLHLLGIEVPQKM